MCRYRVGGGSKITKSGRTFFMDDLKREILESSIIKGELLIFYVLNKHWSKIKK